MTIAMTATDTYVVRFLVRGDDGYWKREEKSYTVNGKGKHRWVEKCWSSEFKFQQVTLIRITYQ